MFTEVAAADPNIIGMSITSLIGSLGAAGAAVAVTYYFLDYLRTDGLKRDRRIAEDREDRSRFAAEMRDALADQRRSFRDELRHQIEMTEAMGGDCLVVMKAIEKTLEALAPR